MKTGRFLRLTTLVCKVAFAWIVATELGYCQVSSNVTVKATGLNSPRGLKFGPDGLLYVAEGGLGGTTSTAGMCDQVVPPLALTLGDSQAAFLQSTRRAPGRRSWTIFHRAKRAWVPEAWSVE